MVFTDTDRREMDEASREIGWLATFGMQLEDGGDAENGPRLVVISSPKLEELIETIAHIDCDGCWGYPFCLVHVEWPEPPEFELA